MNRDGAYAESDDESMEPPPRMPVRRRVLAPRRSVAPEEITLPCNWEWGRKVTRSRVTRPRQYGQDDHASEHTCAVVLFPSERMWRVQRSLARDFFQHLLMAAPICRLGHSCRDAVHTDTRTDREWDSHHDEADEDQILAAVALTEMAGGMRSPHAPGSAMAGGLRASYQAPSSCCTPHKAGALWDGALLGNHVPTDALGTVSIFQPCEPASALLSAGYSYAPDAAFPAPSFVRAWSTIYVCRAFTLTLRMQGMAPTSL